MVTHSATLELNERVAARRVRGEQVLHLGFGEAGLPVLPALAERLARAAGENSYPPVAGTPAARAAVAGYFTRRGVPTTPDQVLLAPGSKALLYALLATLPGDVVLPRPSWVSYAAQAELAGKRVVSVPVPERAGGVPDPELLDRVCSRPGPARPGVLVLTLPDNPTGTLPEADLVREVCAVADRHGLVVVSDEIYRDLCYHPDRHLSPAVLAPDRAVVTGGLSKAMALGGWRVGFARVADPGLAAAVVGVASEVWSSLAAPMQAVAAWVLDEPAEVTTYVAAGRRLHRAVATAAHQRFVEAGARCRPPDAAFYLYPDFGPWRETLAGRGITTGERLARHLLDEHGVAVLPGAAFGDDPAALRFRVATSLLYGDAEQRWASLRSDDPVALPWVADALERLEVALRGLCGLA